MTSPLRTPRPDRIRIGVAGLGAVAQAVHRQLFAKLDDTFDSSATARRRGPGSPTAGRTS